ncbi:MAG: hypothetical protein IPL75_14655 [Acidobacteria bacterium]|nr:hypothetical protein [Acidobacteriota bacterium]
MIRTVNRGLVFMVAVGVLLSSWAMLPSFIDLPLYFLIAAIFTLPGWWLARWVAGDDADALSRAILALPLGYVAGAVTCAALRLVGVSSPFAVLAAITGLALVLTMGLPAAATWRHRARPAGRARSPRPRRVVAADARSGGASVCTGREHNAPGPGVSCVLQRRSLRPHDGGR